MNHIDNISKEDWKSICYFAEHHELTMDYVIDEFVIDNKFICTDMPVE